MPEPIMMKVDAADAVLMDLPDNAVHGLPGTPAKQTSWLPCRR